MRLVMTPLAAAGEPGPLAQILTDWAMFERATGQIVIEAEAVDKWREKGTEPFWVSPEPTKCKAWFDGLKPTKYRVDYAPRIIRYSGAVFHFSKSVESIACNGTTISELKMQGESAAGDLVPLNEGSVRGFDPGEIALHLIDTGMAFTVLGSTFLAGGVDLEALGKAGTDIISVVPQTTGEYAGLTCITVFNPGAGVQSKIWVNPKMKSALRRIESRGTDPKGAESYGITSVFDISEYRDLGWEMPFFPVKMTLQRSKDGALLSESIVTVKNVAVAKAPADNVYALAFPAGTRVFDERLGVSFFVGKSISETVNSIKDQAAKLRLDMGK